MREIQPEVHNSDAEKNSCWCDQCGGYHGSNECPAEPEEDDDEEEHPQDIYNREHYEDGDFECTCAEPQWQDVDVEPPCDVCVSCGAIRR